MKYAEDEGLLWPIEENWFTEEEGKGWLKKEREDFLSKAIGPAEVGSILYAIPNYLDLGLFCYRKDLFGDFFGHVEQPPSDFDKLIELIEPMRKEIRKQGLWGFGFDMEAEETLVCTFLEFLFNTNTRKGKIGKKFHDESDVVKDRPLILSDPVLRDAMIEALETMKRLVDAGLIPYPCTLEHCRDSIFSRHWYSTVQYLYYDQWCAGDETRKEGYENAKFGIMKFPVIKSNKLGDSDGTEYYCCSGSWYLGILKQSLRPRLGYHLIDEITSMGKNFRRYELNAGFPTRRSFYRFYGARSVRIVEDLTYREIADAFERNKKAQIKICRRESICGNDVKLYRTIRPQIADIVLTVLGGELPSKKAADKIVNVIRDMRTFS